MGADSDDEDLVIYGTPIEREEDTSARKRRAVAEAGQLRALPAWKQEVFLSPSLSRYLYVPLRRERVVRCVIMSFNVFGLRSNWAGNLVVVKRELLI